MVQIARIQFVIIEHIISLNHDREWTNLASIFWRISSALECLQNIVNLANVGTLSKFSESYKLMGFLILQSKLNCLQLTCTQILSNLFASFNNFFLTLVKFALAFNLPKILSSRPIPFFCKKFR